MTHERQLPLALVPPSDDGEVPLIQVAIFGLMSHNVAHDHDYRSP